jgi:hypothetical protein
VYQDGSQGEPIPLFDLAPIERPEKLLKVNLGTVSMRHTGTDRMVSAYLIMNLEMQSRKESGASEQEAFAYMRTVRFVSDILRVAQGRDRDAISKKDPVYTALIEHYKIGKTNANGLEISLFQSTGLEPATVGIYRALRDLIKQHRGKLVIVPRILAGEQPPMEWNSSEQEQRQKLDEIYKPGCAWF